MASVTTSAMSPTMGTPAMALSSPRIVSSDDATAFSCSAMYGTEPMMAITATVAATAWLLP